MQKNNKIRIAVDVNIWISALLKVDFRARIDTVFDPEYHLIVSKELFVELESTVRKPHIQKRIDQTNYKELVSLLKTDAEHVDVHSEVNVCRDPKDNYLLALAKDGNADYLITGDGGLLILKEFEKTKIVSIKEFEIIAGK